MLVEEIKAKLPQAEVYELRGDCNYLIVVGLEIPQRLIESMVQVLPEGTLIIRVDDPSNAVRLLEMK